MEYIYGNGLLPDEMFPLAEDQLADEVEDLMDEMQELKEQFLAS